MDNEEYIQPKIKHYNYKAKEELLLDFNEDISSFSHIYICPYKVNNTAIHPFLSFLLLKTNISNKLQWPEVPVFKHFEKSELINYSKIYLFGLCKLIEFEKFDASIIFNGFYKFENNLCLFFDINNCDININDTYSNSSLRFAIIDEIVNHKNVCDFKIKKNVTDLFLSNDKFCFLMDENDTSYEIPIVSFIGTTKERVNFRYTFGQSSENKNAILGPYFYFTNFNNALIEDCVVRFALFIGKVKYIENNQYDPIDESEIKKQRLHDTSLDQNTERLTMRITDHDGLWSKSFDTAYLGQIELDNGKKLENTPLVVVKQYEQQCPLSYHYTNKKYLTDSTHFLIM